MGLNKRPSDGHTANGNGPAHEPSPGTHDWSASKWREEAKLDWDPSSNPAKNGRSTLAPPATSRKERSTSPAKHRWVEGKFGRRARAEYELGGTPDHPVPRIRLFVESPLPSDDEEEDQDDALNSDGGSLSDDHSSQKSLEEKIIELPANPDPTLLLHPRGWARRRDPRAKGATSGRDSSQARHPLSRSGHPSHRRHAVPRHPHPRAAEPLQHPVPPADNFVLETESLCSAIARASSPFATKNDLYVWREIFGFGSTCRCLKVNAKRTAAS